MASTLQTLVDAQFYRSRSRNGALLRHGEKMKFCRSSKKIISFSTVVPTLFWWQTCSIALALLHFCPAICSRARGQMDCIILGAALWLLPSVQDSRLNMSVSDSALTARRRTFVRMNGCGPVTTVSSRALAKVKFKHSTWRFAEPSRRLQRMWDLNWCLTI